MVRSFLSRSLVVVGFVSAGLILWQFCMAGPEASVKQDPLEPVDRKSYPRTIQIPGSNSVRLDAPPQRIIPAASGGLDLVIPFADPSRLAAVPEQASIYASHLEGFGIEEVPRFSRFDVETMLSLRPDLILAHPWQRIEVIQQLHSAQIPIAILPDPKVWAEIREQLLCVASLLGSEDRGLAVVEDLDRRVETLLSEGTARQGMTAMVYSNGGTGGWTAGEGTTSHEFLRLAGLRNVAADGGKKGHMVIEYEELLVLNPDILVVSGRESGRLGSATEDLLRSVPTLAKLSAVRNGRVLTLPPRLYSATSLHVVSAAEHLSEILDRLGQEAKVW